MSDILENIQTDDFDIYNSQGVPEALPGTPDIDESGHLIIPDQPYFSPAAAVNPSVMDPDPRNTGPTTDFWTNFPITIDVNGDIYYYNENTGINVRGPEGTPRYVRYDELTPEEKELLKGQDGVDGRDGRDGIDGQDGQDGLDAYHAWLRDNGWLEQDHPISEFYSYLATFAETLIKPGSGDGSIIANYGGDENEANGNGSFAMGYQNVANGNNSFVAGSHVVSAANEQTVIGKYNLNNQNNAFEVGGGSTNNRKNILSLNWNGTLTVSNEITDGYENTLSNKVDKVPNKGLSTNDFTDSYKLILDHYHVDDALNLYSINPVQNNVITDALNTISTTIASKPTIENEADDNDYQLISYKSIDNSGKLDIGAVMPNIRYNPNRNNLSIGSGNTIGTITTHSTLIGTGLTSNTDRQFIIGKYNANNANNMIEVGDGTNSSSTHNLLTLGKNGNFAVTGTITDGLGNVLSGKQDTLIFDNTPTYQSNNMVTSGNIYAFVNNTVQTYWGSTIQNLQAEVSNLTTTVNTLSATVTALQNNLYYMNDDTTGDRYKIGINNDEFYIQNQVDPPSPQNEEPEEPEQQEEVNER